MSRPTRPCASWSTKAARCADGGDKVSREPRDMIVYEVALASIQTAVAATTSAALYLANSVARSDDREELRAMLVGAIETATTVGVEK